MRAFIIALQKRDLDCYYARRARAVKHTQKPLLDFKETRPRASGQDVILSYHYCFVSTLSCQETGPVNSPERTTTDVPNRFFLSEHLHVYVLFQFQDPKSSCCS